MSRFRSFADARKFARGLGLKTSRQWLAFARGDLPKKGSKPADVPTKPQQAYRSTGWKSWGDWLGSGVVSTQRRKYRPFRRARSFARALNLENQSQWLRHCRETDGFPPDIPINPQVIYAETGWESWGDWLGSGRIANDRRSFRSFSRARRWARERGLTSAAEWREAAPELPADMPRAPDQFYKNAGWKGWGDFLGSGNQPTRSQTRFRTFLGGLRFARSLELKTRAEWLAFCRGDLPGKPTIPDDVPRCPHHVYRNQGWKGYRHWLGTTR